MSNAPRSIPIPRGQLISRSANAPGYEMQTFSAAPPAESLGSWAAVTRFLLVLPVIGGVFLSRFAFNFSDRKLSLPLMVVVASIVGLAVFGKLRVHLPRVILFAIAIAALMTATVLGGTGRVSAMSFLLLAVLYLGYVFVVDGDETTYAWVIVAFRWIGLIIAIAGIAQFFAQWIVPGPTLFTFRGVVPDGALSLEFNYVDPVDFLPGRFKSNGFFLPEPSIFGQFMALAAIVELLFFRPSYRLFVLGLAEFLSFSGSGAILCILFIPLLLLRRGDPLLLLLAVVLGVIFLIFLDSPLLEPLLGRVNEFGSTHSSAFARFLSPFYLFDDYVFTSARNTLFGLGPGSIDAYFNNYHTEVFDPTWGKLFFEYGLVGTLPFAVFIICCFFADSPARWLSSALFFTYVLLGGYLLSAPTNALVLSLVAWHRRPWRPAPTGQWQENFPRTAAALRVTSK
jgi:hypothetical protein